MRVDELQIGEIYKISNDDRVRLVMTEVEHEHDKFLKFDYAALPKDPAEKIFPNDNTPLISQLGLEPLVYIGTKPSRINTCDPVEAAHVFASTVGEHFCILGRHIKYIFPFTFQEPCL